MNILDREKSMKLLDDRNNDKEDDGLVGLRRVE